MANGAVSGSIVVLTIAQTVYLVPWAVLAVPVATALFPRMSSAWEVGDRARAAAIAATGLRATLALAALGTAMLVAAATPTANVLLDVHSDGHSVFAPVIVGFAVGLIGWSLVALLSRVLYAARRPQLAAAGQAFGWLVTIAVDLAIVLEVDRHDRPLVLALGNAAGVTVAAVILLANAVRLEAVRTEGVARTATASVIAAAAGGAAGWALTRTVASTGIALSVFIGLAAAIVAVGVAAATVAIIDRDVIDQVRLLRSARRRA